MDVFVRSGKFFLLSDLSSRKQGGSVTPLNGIFAFGKNFLYHGLRVCRLPLCSTDESVNIGTYYPRTSIRCCFLPNACRLDARICCLTEKVGSIAIYWRGLIGSWLRSLFIRSLSCFGCHHEQLIRLQPEAAIFATSQVKIGYQAGLPGFKALDGSKEDISESKAFLSTREGDFWEFGQIRRGTVCKTCSSTIITVIR